MKTMYATSKKMHSGFLTVKTLKVTKETKKSVWVYDDILQASRREAKDTRDWQVHSDLVTALEFNLKRAELRARTYERRLEDAKRDLSILQNRLIKERGEHEGTRPDD